LKIVEIKLAIIFTKILLTFVAKSDKIQKLSDESGTDKNDSEMSVKENFKKI